MRLMLAVNVWGLATIRMGIYWVAFRTGGRRSEIGCYFCPTLWQLVRLIWIVACV